MLGLTIIIFSLFYLIKFKSFGTPISYILYLLMTYCLIMVSIKVYNIVRTKINKIIDNNKYLKRYKEDFKLRYKISLIISLILNIIYIIFKLISGIIYKSFWFISFVFYYLLLVILRLNIAKQEFTNTAKLEDEYAKYRSIGSILLFINVILTIIILIIVNEKIMNVYPTWIAISVAAYTFYLIVISLYNLVKYRKYKSPLISASKIINVVASLVSLISLEIILIPTFGEGQIEFFEIMIMATGGGIALIITSIAFYMIIRSTEWLNSKRS